MGRARCASGTTTRSPPIRASRRIPTPTWRSSPTSGKARSPKGQPRQRGADRSGRRAGDERRDRHSPRRVQPGAQADDAVPDLDRAGRRRRPAVVGRQAVSQVGPRGPIRHPGLRPAEDDDALPIRTRAGAGATIKAGETTEYELGPNATRISSRRSVASRSMACALTLATAPRSSTSAAEDQSARGQRDRAGRRCVGQNEAKPPPLASRGQRHLRRCPRYDLNPEPITTQDVSP